jgi:DNA mismatch endonuclease, patch repair protein
MDSLSPEHRSWNMSRIKNRDTKPELLVRSMLHRQGYRFRLHRKDLPGKPDIVLPRHKKIILVHGCFWHRHEGCLYAYTPKSRVEFWQEKFKQNIKRDKKVRASLMQLGWEVLVVWECETKKTEVLDKILDRFFN